jgi:hypothetical protein
VFEKKNRKKSKKREKQKNKRRKVDMTNTNVIGSYSKKVEKI